MTRINSSDILVGVREDVLSVNRKSKAGKSRQKTGSRRKQHKRKLTDSRPKQQEAEGNNIM